MNVKLKDMSKIFPNFPNKTFSFFPIASIQALLFVELLNKQVKIKGDLKDSTKNVAFKNLSITLY